MMGKKKLSQKTIIIGLAAALTFVVLGVFVFSYALETFDAKAEELGAQEQQIWTAPFADYTVAGSDSQWIALAVGIAATLLLFGVAFGVAKVLRKKKGGNTL
jgi:ABC-type antimicrobial peptide transport system permease subunit